MSNSNIIERIKKNRFTLMAEIGVNYYDIAHKLHIPLLEAAQMMILAAANAGVHAVKFQSYKAETLASRYSPAYWDMTEESTDSQYALFKKFDSFGASEYSSLSAFCRTIGIEFCSTPFDIDSADYLEDLMEVYKISSSDLSNIPFIDYIAKKNKPILLSIGASNLEEIKEAVAHIRRYNDRELILLHCILEYPTPYAHANLNKIAALREAFPSVYIGYSDHTKPDACYDVIKSAYLLGAVLVEKHFTLDKSLKGNDHYHAMDAHDAACILEGVSFVDSLLGDSALSCLESEQKARTNARRSLVAEPAISAGTIITREMLTFKRPGTGISPRRIDDVVGKKAKANIVKDTILTEEMLTD